MEYIVKYSNRKLYSKTLSKYVTLPYLIDLAKNNPHGFKVVKYRKGESVDSMSDITGEVLAEAIVLLSPSKYSLLSFIRDL